MLNSARNLNNSFIQAKLFPQHVVEFSSKLIDRRVNQFFISQQRLAALVKKLMGQYHSLVSATFATH